MNKFFVLTSIVLLSLASCNRELSQTQKEEYILKGKEIANATASAMLAEVGKNMQQGGVGQTVSFCSEQAEFLTHEMAQKNGVTIKRTSHLIRNEKNKPNAREQEMISHFLKMKAEAKELKPMVEKNNYGTVQFYAPIMVAQKCTLCHGVLGETLSVQSDSIIKTVYPKDQAIGFRENDIRGIWSINFLKK